MASSLGGSELICAMEIFRSERLASAFSALMAVVLEIDIGLPYVQMGDVARRTNERAVTGRIDMFILENG